jgi:hypothetical protein
MAFNLKNPKTLAAIDELARLTGQSKAEAVASAVEARLEALLDEQRRDGEATLEERFERIMALSRDTAARLRAAGAGPDSQGRFRDLTDELYDGDGLPV